MKNLSLVNLKKVTGHENFIEFIEAFGLDKYNVNELDIIGDQFSRIFKLIDKRDTAILPQYEFVCGDFNFTDPNDEAIRILKEISDKTWSETTRDTNGFELSYLDKTGYSYNYTRDSYSNKLAYKDRVGYVLEFTRDVYGRFITIIDSNGLNHVRTRSGNKVTSRENGKLVSTAVVDNYGKVIKFEGEDGTRYDTNREYVGTLARIYKNEDVILEIKLKQS